MKLYEMADDQDMVIYVKGNTINIIKNRFGDGGKHENVKLSIDVSGPADPMMTIEDGIWERIRAFFKMYHPTREQELDG